MPTNRALEELLADLAKGEIKVWVDGERLRYKAARGAPAPELLSRLQTHKPELMVLLGAQSGPDVSPAVRTHPPSFAQSRFLALQKLNPADAFFNVPFVFRIAGKLDSAILKASFNEIVKRHEILRTSLREINGNLMQVVQPQGEINLTLAELDPCLPDDRDAALWRRLQAEMERPFDLANESGLRVLLLRTGADEHFLQLCFHNTLFDQSSLMVVLKELSAHYAALSAGQTATLPAPAQYAEYASWQQSLAASGMEERLRYWREWFDRGESPKWKWTPSKGGPGAADYRTHVVWQRCTQMLTRQLKVLSQSSGGTLYLTLLTAWALILSRYTACDDIVFGTTYSNRHHRRFATLIGATIDVPAIRVDMTDNPTLPALLARVRAAVAGALTYQDVPFEQIAPSFLKEGRVSGPLFRMVFSFFAEVPHGRLQLPDAAVTFLEERINDISRPDLYLVFWENQTESGEALTGYWMHKRDIFDAETAEKMNREFAALLSAMISQPTQRVQALLESV
jgi:hypothetical protein